MHATLTVLECACVVPLHCIVLHHSDNYENHTIIVFVHGKRYNNCVCTWQAIYYYNNFFINII